MRVYQFRHVGIVMLLELRNICDVQNHTGWRRPGQSFHAAHVE